MKFDNVYNKLIEQLTMNGSPIGSQKVQPTQNKIVDNTKKPQQQQQQQSADNPENKYDSTNYHDFTMGNQVNRKKEIPYRAVAPGAKLSDQEREKIEVVKQNFKKPETDTEGLLAAIKKVVPRVTNLEIRQ